MKVEEFEIHSKEFRREALFIKGNKPSLNRQEKSVPLKPFN